MIRLLVVDDHTLFRRGLVALLSADGRCQVVAQAGDASQAQRLAAEHQPDVILLDNHLPGVHGVDAVQGLREASPRARVLMLTVSEDERDLAAALRAGAQGYLLKTIDADALVDSLHRVLQGQSVISPEMTPKLVSAFQALHNGPGDVAGRDGMDGTAPAPANAVPDPLHDLSPREREILHHVARGGSNKHIARELGITEATVKAHMQNMLRKLGLSSRVQAAVFATQRQVSSGQP